MSPESASKQLMIGLPSAGKSTFLAALWQVVTSNEIPESLDLIQLDGDITYIDNLHRRWLSGSEVGRTSLVEDGLEEKVTMQLGKNDKIHAEITFPDLSGELFNLQWVDRKWSPNYDDLARSASGALLFINPKNVNSGDMITPEIEQAVKEIQEDEISEEDETKEFDPWESPTQVKMVELLQFIAEKNYLESLRNIALIISSWDIARERFKSPDDYLARQLPLLNQYLTNNKIRFNYQVFGVSGQGGELIDNNGNRTNQADELVNIIKPSERILVQV